MTPEIRKLYLFHLFNSIATTVVASSLFLDRLFLRMQLDESQIGTIKGVGFWVAMTLNLTLAPWIMRLKLDRQLAAAGYLLRITLPMGFLVLPFLTENRTILTAACTALVIASLTPAILANNSVFALCMRHIPREVLGRHMGRINVLWNLPFLLLAIPCGRYIDRFADAGDVEFYRAFALLYAVTAAFQLPGSWLMWRLPREPINGQTESPPRFIDVIEPFRHRRFRSLLGAILATSTIAAMVMSFIYIYLLRAHELTMFQISMLEAVAGLIGFLLMPLWGNLTDRIGGRNVMTLSALGIAVAMLLMVGDSIIFILLAAALAWKTTTGVFGAGLAIGQQCLTMGLAEDHRRNIYLAASTFVAGCGMLIGAVLGGYLLEWLAERVDPLRPYEYYKIYFLFCSLFFLLIVSFISSLRDGRRRITPLQITIDLYRRIRNFAGRSR